MKRIVPLLVLASLVCTLFLVPVGAVDVEGSATFDVRYSYRTSTPTYLATISGISFPRSASTATYEIIDREADNGYPVSISSIDTGAGDLGASGAVGVYFTFYYSFTGGTLTESNISNLANDWIPVYYDQNGLQQNISDFDVTILPRIANDSSSMVSFSGNVSLSGADTLTRFQALRANYDSAGNFALVDFSSSVYATLLLVVPSFSIVATEASADLEALENIADQISQNNAIMQAMYGDIMSALNAILEKTGSLEAAQEVANAYILQVVQQLQQLNSTSSSIYTLLSTYLHYLQQIAQTAEDIKAELAAFHSDFMTKLDLLISTVSQESDDIQAKMEEIYEQLQAWLDSQFEQAIDDDFEQGNADLEQGIQNNDQIEQQWTGSLSDAWAQTGIDDFAFDAGFTSAFMWVSGWFSTFFNAFGVYSQILLFPAILGLAMLLLGMFRSGRLGSRGSSGPRGTPVDVPNGEYHRYDPW